MPLSPPAPLTHVLTKQLTCDPVEMSLTCLPAMYAPPPATHIYRHALDVPAPPSPPPSPGVQVTCLLVLSHLITSDMMKVKGHISKIVLCLRGRAAPRLRETAQRFFATLARKANKARNPIFAHVPDILSNLAREDDLSREDFESIMSVRGSGHE